MQTDTQMGFDDYLYTVTAIDEDGTLSEYEYGNKEKAYSHYSSEQHAFLSRYKAGEKEVLEEK